MHHIYIVTTQQPTLDASAQSGKHMLVSFFSDAMGSHLLMCSSRVYVYVCVLVCRQEEKKKEAQDLVRIARSYIYRQTFVDILCDSLLLLLTSHCQHN